MNELKLSEHHIPREILNRMLELTNNRKFKSIPLLLQRIKQVSKRFKNYANVLNREFFKNSTKRNKQLLSESYKLKKKEKISNWIKKITSNIITTEMEITLFLFVAFTLGFEFSLGLFDYIITNPEKFNVLPVTLNSDFGTTNLSFEVGNFIATLVSEFINRIEICKSELTIRSLANYVDTVKLESFKNSDILKKSSLQKLLLSNKDLKVDNSLLKIYETQYNKLSGTKTNYHMNFFLNHLRFVYHTTQLPWGMLLNRIKKECLFVTDSNKLFIWQIFSMDGENFWIGKIQNDINEKRGTWPVIEEEPLDNTDLNQYVHFAELTSDTLQDPYRTIIKASLDKICL